MQILQNMDPDKMVIVLPTALLAMYFIVNLQKSLCEKQMCIRDSFYLVENKNIALSRDKLLSDIWGYDFFGDDRTIDTHIKNLRNNLGKYRDYIVTLRGVGYKFEA